MEPKLLIYRKFNDIAFANALVAELEEHGISYVFNEEAQSFDPTFSYVGSKEYVVKISSTDFERVNNILNKDVAFGIDEVDKDYYLLKFNEAELIDVIAKPDEWNPYDVQLSRKLLAKKGRIITDQDIKELGKNRLVELKKPQGLQSGWIAVGYVCALAGGVLGFFLGWHLLTYKKTLPDGQRVFDYNESDRKQGRNIFYLSFVGFAFALFYRILPAFSGN